MNQAHHLRSDNRMEENMKKSYLPHQQRRSIMVFSIFTALFFAILSFLSNPSIHAAPAIITFNVDSALDQVDDNPGDGVCHTASNFCTLRAAITEANFTIGVSPIVMLPAGIYTLTISPSGIDDITSGDLNIITPTVGSPIMALQGADQTGIDPLIGPLQDKGGRTLTHALLPNSPAIDAGNPSGCVDDLGATLLIDQRGWRRPFGARCDICAYELGASLYLPLVVR